MNHHDLAQERDAAAEGTWDAYDFDGYKIEAQDGFSSSGDEMVRVFYLEAEDPRDPTEKAHFAVRFAPGSATVEDAYALDSHGAIIGSNPSAAPAP